MREIKFRAWDEDGYMTYPIRIDFSPRMGVVVWDTPTTFGQNGSAVFLMQFTGLRDKNGKEIYEGDLLRYEDEGNIMDSGIYTVQWDEEDAGWGLNGSATCAGQTMRLSEVIGNVYETPELEE